VHAHAGRAGAAGVLGQAAGRARFGGAGGGRRPGGVGAAVRGEGAGAAAAPHHHPPPLLTLTLLSSLRYKSREHKARKIKEKEQQFRDQEKTQHPFAPRRVTARRRTAADTAAPVVEQPPGGIVVLGGLSPPHDFLNGCRGAVVSGRHAATGRQTVRVSGEDSTLWNVLSSNLAADDGDGDDFEPIVGGYPAGTHVRVRCWMPNKEGTVIDPPNDERDEEPDHYMHVQHPQRRRRRRRGARVVRRP